MRLWLNLLSTTTQRNHITCVTEDQVRRLNKIHLKCFALERPCRDGNRMEQAWRRHNVCVQLTSDIKSAKTRNLREVSMCGNHWRSLECFIHFLCEESQTKKTHAIFRKKTHTKVLENLQKKETFKKVKKTCCCK